MSNHPDDEIDVLSTVKLKLLDPLGRAIDGLRYEVRQGAKVVAQGATDAEGRLKAFSSEIGKPISIQVERFVSESFKEIRQITPWSEQFSVKLISGKVKQPAAMVKSQGDPGTYRRKTHTVEQGDTLSQLASKHGTTAREIAALNGIGLDSILKIGQVLKLPHPQSGATTPPPAPSSPPAPSAVRSVERSAVNGPEPKPATTIPPQPVSLPQVPPPTTPVSEGRGESGTPKTIISLSCEGTSCIKLGDKGPLIEELNIRLTGFGGTVSAPKLLNEFSEKTDSAVRQFQRDYMGAPETGKVCASFLRALDDFRAKHPVSLSAMKCRCGKCEGFGSNQNDSSAAGMFRDAKKTLSYKGTEYPGMHRAVIWGLRAALFYSSTTDKDLTYKFLQISSGYRCWHDNKAHNRTSTNHMGNALDLQFSKGGASSRCQGEDVDNLRSKIFVKRLGAQLSWPEDNKLSLETAAQGATSWVHLDVREYETQYKDTRFYAVTQAAADGDLMVDIAKREGRQALLACGGISVETPQVVRAPDRDDERIAVASLAVSQKGIEFIQGWEKCGLKPYDDSEGFCTIGWGHLIERESCESIKDKTSFQRYKNGVDQVTADKLLVDDIKMTEDIVKARVQVPLFQHEYDALVSLIFNLGGFRKCPKLLSKLNTKDYKGCCDEFADITNNNTSGLVKRRKAEMNIFNNKVYDASH